MAEAVQVDPAAAAEFVARVASPPSVMTFVAGGGQRHPTMPTTAAVRDFIAAHPRDDVYFVIADRRDAMVLGKPAKGDCVGAGWAWVDIDPPKGLIDPVQLAAWRSDQLAALDASGLPPPPVLINSGRGLWALWRLTRRVPPDEIEAINRALAERLRADHCHNIDRVVRVPFTYNTKVGEVATLLRDEPYTIAPEALPRAAAIAPSETPSAPTPTIGARVASLDELDRFGVPDRVKVVLNIGHHPDEPKQGDNSRSAWVFDAVCQLVRCDVPDDTIMAVLTDPAWGISASVLDKGHGAERYAARQIERARQHVVDPNLAELNERHFVVENDGGRCRVAEWVPADGDGREMLLFQSFDDFRNRYMNRHVEVGTDARGAPTTKPLGGWWLSHRGRRQYRGLLFRPGGEPVVDGRLNLWRGFGIDPAPGDWPLMRAHIRDVLASGDATCDEYILRWAAWAVQHPDQPAEVALVFRGAMGTGKGTFARAIRRLFGQHGLHVNSPAQVAGRFNAHLRDVCLLFADEAIRPDDRAARGILKAMLTEPTLPIEGKGKDVLETRNYIKVVMASNEGWVVPVDDDDRRFAVFDVSKARQRDELYFQALNAELEGGGLGAMLHDLLAMDLAGWHPRQAIPDTAARQEQRAATLDGFDAVFLDLLREGEIPAIGWPGVGRPRVSTLGLRDLAAARTRRSDVTLNQVSDLLKRLGFEKVRQSRPSGFVLPALPDARAAWDRVRAPVAWDDAHEWIAMDVPTGSGGAF